MTASPTISSVQYAVKSGAGLITVFWNAAGGTSFSIKVTDTTAGTSTLYPEVGFFATISTTLNASHAYTISVACTDSGTGPYSTAIPILTAGPTITLAQNQVTSVLVNWTAPTGYAGQFAATLQTQNAGSVTNTTSALTTSFPQQTPISGTSTTISVQLQNTVSGATTTGPASQYTIITVAPTLSAVDYSSGTALVLTWTAPSGYNTCVASLAASSGSTTRQTSTTGTTSFSALSASASYTACVAASSADGVSQGPPSTTYPVITAKPTMTSVINTGSALALGWQTLAGCSGYKAYKQAAGSQPSGIAVAGTAYSFNGPLSAGAATTCWVCGTGSGGVVTGPPSTVYTALTANPTWVLVSYDSGQMALTWTAVTGGTVTGYLVTVTGIPQPSNPVGNVTTTNITATLTPKGSYPSVVAATNGIVQGPPSPTLFPLTAPPVPQILGYTGAKLQFAWGPSGESGVSGYATQLLSNGTSPETTTATASPQLYATSFKSGTVYTARARCCGTATQGPWSQAVTGPYQAQITYTYDSLGRIQTVAWAAGFTETYQFDSAGNLLSASYAATP